MVGVGVAVAVGVGVAVVVGVVVGVGVVVAVGVAVGVGVAVVVAVGVAVGEGRWQMTRDDLREMGLLELMLAICAEHHVTLVDMLGPRRSAMLARARLDAYRYLRSRGASYPEIARIFGRDHTTIMSAVRGAAPLLRPIVGGRAGQ